VEKELAKIVEKAKPFVEAGMCHEDVCEAVIQQQYVSAVLCSCIAVLNRFIILPNKP
jgi:hypothetical protein